MADLVVSMKKAALAAIEASNPVAVMFGVVLEVKPLKINVEQKITLEEPQLILTQTVTKVKTSLSTTFSTENALSTDLEHFHRYSGTMEVTIDTNLKKGDKVVLLRMQGGQKFIVLDRVNGYVTDNK